VNGHERRIQDGEDDAEVALEEVVVGLVVEGHGELEGGADGDGLALVELLIRDLEVGMGVNGHTITDLLDVCGGGGRGGGKEVSFIALANGGRGGR
jgi:hypothetical protein